MLINIHIHVHIHIHMHILYIHIYIYIYVCISIYISGHISMQMYGIRMLKTEIRTCIPVRDLNLYLTCTHMCSCMNCYADSPLQSSLS